MSSLLDQPTPPVPDVDELERLQQLVGWGWPAGLACAAVAGLVLLSRR
jgi:hypothetical protein